MKRYLTAAGVLVALSGAVWFLQGICVLPGSLMSCQRQWAIYGGLAIVVGAGLIVYSRKRD